MALHSGQGAQTARHDRERRARRSAGEHRGAIVAVVLLAGGILLLLAVTRLAAARAGLVAARTDLESARAALITRRDPAARLALGRATTNLREAGREARGFPLRPLRSLPVLGSPAKAVEDVIAAGHSVVRAGQALVAASGSFPARGGSGVEGSDLTPFHGASLRSLEAIEDADEHLATASRTLSRPAGALLPQVSGVAGDLGDEVDQARRTLERASRTLWLLAQLSAQDADVRLLLLSQDSLELRPTGGYIGSYGVLRFSRGTVGLEKFDSSHSLPAPEPPIEPPDDLAPVLPKHWGVSNANWWPDFPTSARTARELFRRQQGGEVDGVIGLTERAIARLIGAVGPLTLPSYAEPVVEQGFAERVIHEVELKRPLDEPRKKFLIEMSHVLFARLFSLPADRLPAVGDALASATAGGDVQLWFARPDWQRRLDGTVLAGRLPSVKHDFLMLVDANVSASKANAGLVKEATYRVRREGDGTLRAALEVVVRNEGARSPVNPYYNGYLRVYVPWGSRLRGEASGEGVRARDGPYRVLSRVLDVQPGGEQRVKFEYALPARVAPGGRYQLSWVRQVGTGRDVLRALLPGRGVDVPSGERLLRARASFRDNAVIEFLKSRWVLRRIGLFGRVGS